MARGAPLTIDNETARRLLLHVTGLMPAMPAARTVRASGKSAARTVERLGMVQLDPIRTVARAHEHITRSRKLALEKLWLEGTLAVSHRRGFVKHYDLAERIVPRTLLDASRNGKADEAAEIDRLCRDALERLGVATPGELQRFWEALSPGEVRGWIAAHRHELVDVRVAAADGRHIAMLAFADIETRLAALERAGTRTRILNPFDPLVRDRRRLARLFGVDFRIEIYVPPAKRRYGYYVYPVLEGTRVIARTEVRAERDRDRLEVRGLWPEPGIRFGAGRRARFAAELDRFARLAGVGDVLDMAG